VTSLDESRNKHDGGLTHRSSTAAGQTTPNDGKSNDAQPSKQSDQSINQASNLNNNGQLNYY